MKLSRVICLTILLPIAAGATAIAEDVPFALTSHFQLRVDGTLDEAALLYLTQRGAPRLLVVSERLEDTVVVAAGAKKAMALGDAAGGADAIGADTIALDAGSLAVSDGAAVDVKIQRGAVFFGWQGRQVALEPSEPLTGALTRGDLLSSLPEYRRNAALYDPSVGAVRLLSQIDRPTQIEVFFGSWCPHCEQVVPRLLKVLDVLGNENIEVSFYGLPRGFSDDPMARQNGVKGLPTAIVRRDGQVVGRLEGPLFNEPEQALAATLFGD
jgi:thiol-disulfide isomerase/thioredoxin